MWFKLVEKQSPQLRLLRIQNLTLLADRHHENARSQAPAWERTAVEALHPASAVPSLLQQAEPAIHWVPRQSLGTSWWCSARSVQIFHFAVFNLAFSIAFTCEAATCVFAKFDIEKVKMKNEK